MVNLRNLQLVFSITFVFNEGFVVNLRYLDVYSTCGKLKMCIHFNVWYINDLFIVHSHDWSLFLSQVTSIPALCCLTGDPDAILLVLVLLWAPSYTWYSLSDPDAILWARSYNIQTVCVVLLVTECWWRRWWRTMLWVKVARSCRVQSHNWQRPLAEGGAMLLRHI